METELDNDFPTKLQVYPRSHDTDRNLNLPLHSITRYASIYRVYCGYMSFQFTALLKAQYIAYRPNHQHRDRFSLIIPSSQKPQYETLNYLLDNGTTSFWQVTHLKNKQTNKIIADNIILMVGFNRMIKKPTNLPNTILSICDKNKIIYPQRHDRKYLDEKKKLISKHILSLKELMTSNITDYNECIFRMKLQLRWSDEDFNKHINSTYCVRLIEECCFEWNKDLRNNNNKMFIDSITVLYVKEISVEKHPFCYPIIWYMDDNQYYYGTIDVINEKNTYQHKVGFTVKLRSNKKRKANL